jgi:hypothetical protein
MGINMELLLGLAAIVAVYKILTAERKSKDSRRTDGAYAGFDTGGQGTPVSGWSEISGSSDTSSAAGHSSSCDSTDSSGGDGGSGDCGSDFGGGDCGGGDCGGGD